MTGWQILITVGSSLVLLWLILVIVLWWTGRKQSDKTTLIDALRLLPDVIRLLRRLVSDSTVPRTVRIWLVVLLVYLLFPIDVIPDFIPVLGYADDAIIIALVLRYATKHAGPAALDKHWPGTPQGLQVVRTLAGLAPGTDGAGP